MSVEEARDHLPKEKDLAAVIAVAEPGDDIQYFFVGSEGVLIMGSEGYALFRGKQLVRTFGVIQY
jgi:hypothetical protein